MLEGYVKVGHLQVANILYEFVNSEVIPESNVTADQFWSDYEKLLNTFEPENKRLLKRREELQNKLHAWHKENETIDFESYKAYLKELNYLEQSIDDFQITTKHVDKEVSLQAGAQLVVPVNNSRYALNAANSRWGSLYDALYGTDVISEEAGVEIGNSYNPARGQKVVSYGKDFLDRTFPLAEGSHHDVLQYSVKNGELLITLKNEVSTKLKNSVSFVGYTGNEENPNGILLKNNELHVEIQTDRSHPIGKTDQAGVKDILMEAAVSTIMDCEDSVTAVDAEDKVLVYRNWLGLMKGTLSVTFAKGEKSVTRALNQDRTYTAPSGEQLTLSGRSLMFSRNVGHLMTTDAILNQQGEETPEGIMDAVITGLIGKHDLLGNSPYRNSQEGSIYIVKPKMHGSAEVAFCNRLFDDVEDLIGVPRHTLKIGVMDEERRTTLNLKNCIHEVKDRIVFINTGFLDRTGDEIHTSMEAGAMIRKYEMKGSTWLQAYEDANVITGLATGFKGRAQIGKGMWAMPDLMADMIKQKIGHLHAGANTAWVPSPTAASLHALHYHEVNVKEIQNNLERTPKNVLDDILDLPIAENTDWSPEEVQQELDNNSQGILGYVVRWVEHGIGCSKVPDINHVELMEDRATLRISSQHMANWLHHGICTEDQILETMKRMANVVDKQNEGDSAYRPMAPNFHESVAFQAACDLVFKGYQQPSGYTEPILHQKRKEAKAKMTS